MATKKQPEKKTPAKKVAPKKPSPQPAPPKPVAKSPKKTTAKKTAAKKTTAKTTPARSNGKHPGGRPTKYNAELHPKLVKALLDQGKTITETCAEMKISLTAFYSWQELYPEFSEAIKDAKEKADEKVEASLYKMATGYEHRVEKPLLVGDGMGESHVEIVEYTERLPPNPTAMIFWLKNRKPKDWRDKQEIGLTDKDGNDRSFSITFTKPE